MKENVSWILKNFKIILQSLDNDKSIQTISYPSFKVYSFEQANFSIFSFVKWDYHPSFKG